MTFVSTDIDVTITIDGSMNDIDELGSPDPENPISEPNIMFVVKGDIRFS